MFVDRDIAYRLELAHAMRMFYYTEAYGRLKPELPIEMVHIGGGVAKYAGPDSALNRAIAVGFSTEDPADVIDQVEAFYRRHAAPPCFEVCPLAQEGFLETLKQRGYRLERFFNVVACRLPDEIAPLYPPAGVEVQRASPEQGPLWIYTTAQGFDETDAAPSAEELDMIAPNFHSRNAECYLAYVDGQPAGGGGLYTYQGVVELGGASTRPAYRRRGVQAALLLRRMQDAWAAGIDLAMATTQPGSASQRNMERLGLHLAYTKARVRKVG